MIVIDETCGSPLNEEDEVLEMIELISRLPQKSPIEEQVDFYGIKVTISREWYEEALKILNIFRRWNEE